MTNAEALDLFTTHVRARTTALWIVTSEETRVERLLARQGTLISSEAPASTWVWDAAHGLRKFFEPRAEGQRAFVFDPTAKNDETREITAALDHIASRHAQFRPESHIYVLRDAHRYFGPDGDPVTIRTLRGLAQQLARPVAGPDASSVPGIAVVVVVGPSGAMDATLTDDVVRVEWPLPDRPTVGAILNSALSGAARGVDGAARAAELTAKLETHGREAVIDAAVGLTSNGVLRALATSDVRNAAFDPALIVQAKKEQVSGAVLRWVDSDPRGIDAVGGLGALKAELLTAAQCAAPAATAAGLSLPKGLMVFGVPGCGKSAVAKAAGAVFKLPVLRFDPNAAKSKFVGSSEEAIRNALRTIDAVAPVVLWIDEVEKAFAGSMTANDSGVASYTLGAFLHWMQEHQGFVYIMATANGVESLPPEFMRKGRFDDVFFVDLPTSAERLEILRATLTGQRYAVGAVDLDVAARATDRFTGAEVAEIVHRGVRVAFCDGQRPLQTDDLLSAARQIVPLGQTADDKVRALREWAKTRARPAAAPVAPPTPVAAALDLDAADVFSAPAPRGRGLN